MGFVFPVHAWNPPDTFMEFIRKLNIKAASHHYIYAIATCGDSSGHSRKVFEKALQKKGWQLNVKWEIQMPNNYLPLQDVDSPELEEKNLAGAAKKVLQINHSISTGNSENSLMEDKYPMLKTPIIGFFFRTFGKSSRPFLHTNTCTGCGLCQAICLRDTIRIRNGRPH